MSLRPIPLLILLAGCSSTPGLVEQWQFNPSPPRPSSSAPSSSRLLSPLASSAERVTPAASSPVSSGRAVSGVTVDGVSLDVFVRTLAAEADLGTVLVVPGPGDWPAVTVREGRTLQPDEVCSLLGRVAAAHAASVSCADGAVVLARVSAGRTVQVLRLRDRRPSEIAAMLQGQSAPATDGAPPTAPFRAFADDATRTLIIIGNVSEVSEAVSLAASLDTPAMAGMVYRFATVGHPSTVGVAVRPLLPPSVGLSVVGDGVLLAGARGEVERALEVVRMIERQTDRVVYRYTLASLDSSRCGEYAGGSSGSVQPVKPTIATSAAQPANGGSLLGGSAPASTVPPRVAGAPLSSVVTTDGNGGLDLLAPSAAPSGLVVRTVPGACVLRGTPGEVAEAVEMLRAADRPPVRVQIEAALLEASVSDGLALGLRGSLSISGDVMASALGGPVSALAQVASGVFSGQFVSGGVRGVVEAAAAATNGRVHVLSAPSVLADVGQPAELFSGDQVPVVERQQAGQVDETRIVNSITYRDVGVILRVTPEVREGGRINLRVVQEVSDAVRTNTSGIDSPTITRRGVNTVLTVQDGQTVVLGGLLRETVDDTRENVPGLSQVPVIGSLFDYRSQRKEQKELALVITPRIVDDADLSALAQTIVDRIARIRGGRRA